MTAPIPPQRESRTFVDEVFAASDLLRAGAVPAVTDRELARAVAALLDQAGVSAVGGQVGPSALALARLVERLATAPTGASS